MPLVGRRIEGGDSALVGHVGIGAGLKKDGHGVRVSGLGGGNEGGQSTLVGRVRIDAGIEECSNRLGVSPSGGVDQGSVRMRMGGVERGEGENEQREHTRAVRCGSE